MFDRYVVTPVIALGLAFLIWVYLRSRDQVVEPYQIPVAVTIDAQQADRFEFETKLDAKVRVKFYGLPSRLQSVKDMVGAGELVVRKVARVPIEVDQKQDSEYRETLQLDASSLMAQLPPGVHAEITPAEGRVPISLVRITEKSLTLQHSVTSTGAQFELDGTIRIEPATVTV